MTDLQEAVSMLEQHGLSRHNVSRERNIRESFLDSLIFIMIMLHTKEVNRSTL